MTPSAPRLPAARIERNARQRWAVAAGALAAAATGVSLTGTTTIDVAWLLLLGGISAYIASTAKRSALLVAVVVAIVGVHTWIGAVLALGALVAAACSTARIHRRVYFTRGLAGGLVVASALASAADRRPIPAALVVAGVAVPVLASGVRGMERGPRRHLRRGGMVTVGFAVALSLVAAVAVAVAAPDVDAGADDLAAGLELARQGDVEGATDRLDRAERRIHRGRDLLGRWAAPARLVPVVGQHVHALTDVLDATDGSLGVASRTAALVGSDALTVQAGRIDVDAVSGLRFPLRRLSNALEQVVDAADDHTGGPLLPALRARLERLEREADRAASEAALGSRAAAAAPDLFGSGGATRYLVLFTSPAEARGRFGFPGSYAEVSIHDGRFRLLEHGTTSTTFADLEADPAGFDAGDESMRPYLAFGPTREFRSVTVPPDFPTVATAAAELWEQSGRAPVDGVVRMDPAGLAPLLDHTGPVVVDEVPEPLTAQNLERFLVFDQYVQFPDEQAPRRELLDTVSEVTFDRLQAVDLPGPRTLLDRFGPLVAQGHVDVAMFGAPGEFLDDVGLSGAFDPPRGDGIMVTNVNSGANKIDTFLRRRVDYAARVDDGELAGTLEVTLDNLAPDSGLPFYVIGSLTVPPLPPGTNRTTLLVYTGVPVVGASVGGMPVDIRSRASDGRWVHQLTVDLPPETTRVVSFDLRGPAPPGDGLVIEPGGGAAADVYAVSFEADGVVRTFAGPVAEPTLVR